LDDDFLHDVHEAFAHVLAMDDLVAEAIDDLALFVHDVVVFQRAFADLVIVLIRRVLGLLDGAVQEGCSSSCPSSRPTFSMTLTIGPEPNKRMRSSSREMKKWEEPGSPWRAQRPRNWRSMRRASWRSVPMTWRPPGFGDAGAQFDVGAAAGHVGGDGDAATLTGAGDDFGFLLVVFGVEDGVDDAGAFEHAGEVFADFDGDGADEDGPALAVDLLDFAQDGVVFLAPGLVDGIVGVGAGNRFVGGTTRTPSL
jgi:hypothetical protein